MLRRSTWLTRLLLPALVLSWLGLSSAWAHAEDYLITVIDARLASKKANGKNWDLSFFKSKLPDAYVMLSIGNYKLRTPVVRNTLLPRWNISRKYSLKSTDRVTIALYDRDRLSKHDLIGKTSMTFAQLRKHQSLTFGQVLALRIKVLALNPPKPRVVRTPPRRVEPRPVPRRVVVARPVPRRAKPVPVSKEDVFCLSMIKQSLTCMKKQQAVFLKSGDANKLKIATALDNAVKQAEAALKNRGRVFQVMMMRCRSTIKREGAATRLQDQDERRGDMLGNATGGVFSDGANPALTTARKSDPSGPKMAERGTASTRAARGHLGRRAMRSS